VRQASTIDEKRGRHREPGRARLGIAVATTYVAAAVAITAASGPAHSADERGAARRVCTNRVARPDSVRWRRTRFLELDGASRSRALTAVGVSTIAPFAARDRHRYRPAPRPPTRRCTPAPSADSLLVLLFVIAARSPWPYSSPRFAPHVIAFA
jgi:hypothetical protein